MSEITIVNPEEFSLHVKKMAKSDGDTLFNTLMECCEIFDIPVEDIKPYITEQLMNDLEGEGIRYNTIKQRSKTKRILG